MTEIFEPVNEKILKQGIMHLQDYDNFEISEELEEAEKIIEDVLSHELITRNSDSWLILLSWFRQGKARYTEINRKSGYFIAIEDINDLIPAETITRVRRLLNEQGRHLPTDPHIIAKRKIRAEKFREVLGQNKCRNLTSLTKKSVEIK